MSGHYDVRYKAHWEMHSMAETTAATAPASGAISKTSRWATSKTTQWSKAFLPAWRASWSTGAAGRSGPRRVL